MKKLYTLVFFLTTSIMLGQSNYLVENFNYPAGALLDANGWFIHSGISSSTGLPINSTNVNNGGLTWTTYIGSGIGNAALVNNTGADLNRPLAGNITDGTVYASFLFKPSAALTSTSTSNYFFHFLKYANEITPVYTATNSAFRARAFALRGTDPATQFKLGLNFNGGDFISPSNVTADLDITKTYLVVVKYTFVDGLTNDSVSMFVFEEGANISTEPGTPTLGPFFATSVSSTDATIAPDILTIQGVALRQNSAGQNAIVDGIYVRTVWNLVDAGTALSTNNFALSQISLYPNPVVSVLNVKINSNLIDQPYAIIDGLGRVVLKGKLNEVENTINVAQLSKGIYYIKLSDNKSSKFIKE